LTDQEIIAEINSGNQNAYREIILRYESQVAATVKGMLGNCEEAEDVGQEVFIRFYKSIAKFRAESSVGTYLTRIAINLSLNELKRRKRHRFFFKHPTENEMENKANDNEKTYEEDQEIIQKVLQKLDEKFRSVIVLRIIDGYSTEETASILKVPIGTVLSRLTRALQKLKSLLSPIMEVSNG
jgi:RNA polymerase sigma-70 factor (ECF subfamily)